MLTLKTKPKNLGFAATPDQMGWVSEKVCLTPYVGVVLDKLYWFPIMINMQVS